MLILIAHQTLFGQQNQDYIKNVDVFKTADSIKHRLYTDGIDTVIFLYRNWAYYPVLNRDFKKEEKASFILWVHNGKLNYQRINEYAVYKVRTEKPKNSLLGYLFRYYDFFYKEIEQERIDFTPLLSSDKDKPISELTEDGDFTIFEYKIGSYGRLQYWYSIPISYNDSKEKYTHLNSILLNWIKLVETEFKNSMSDFWAPMNVKLLPSEAETDFIKAFQSELARQEKRQREYNEFHKFKSQEILIPFDYKGVITIIQNQSCGQTLKIKDETRKISIPKNGILLLKKNYLNYYKELYHNKDLEKTAFYLINQQKRTKLDFLEWDDKNLEKLGVYRIGLVEKDFNGKKYELINLYMGTYKELKDIYDKKTLIDETKVRDVLIDCN